MEINRHLKTPRALLLAFSVMSVGCGMSADGANQTQSALIMGMPRCDVTLLHPRITVAATAVLPGKSIVYVDGVMACVDDTARVDVLINQAEKLSATPSK